MSKNTFTNEKVKPYESEEDKTSQLVRMFNNISGEYDRFNDLASLGLAHSWRRKSLGYLKTLAPKRILDIATGTADVCLEAYRILSPDTILGIDISEQMLEEGRLKLKSAGLDSKIQLELQDCASLPYPDDSFDAVTISFGLRNLEKLSESLTHIHRVLRPGGQFLIIEVNEPQSRLFNSLYHIYMKVIISISNLLFAKDKKAYKYLTRSMAAFPRGKQLISILEDHQLKSLHTRHFSFGVCSAYLLEKV